MGIQFVDKVVLVTGANRGIGKVLVETAIAQGAKKVYAAVRRVESVEPLQAEYGDKIVPVRLDLIDQESIGAAAATANDVEIVINNGGIIDPVDLLDPSAIDHLQREMNVNVYGLMRLANAFAPVLQSNGGGALVQMNSVVSIKTFADFATYSASKAASYAITQGLRERLAPQGTQVVSIHPGPIATDMAESAGLMDMADPPQVVADALVTALDQEQFHVFPDTMARDFWNGYQSYAESFVEPLGVEEA